MNHIPLSFIVCRRCCRIIFWKREKSHTV